MTDTYYYKLITVLVVDDSITMRRLIVQELKTLGFTKLIECGSGEEAWEMLDDPLAEHSFDLILLDWHMSRMSGLDLLKKLRYSNKYKKTATIMLTSEQKINQVREAIRSGANDYIIKPLQPKIFQRKLDRISKHFDLKGRDPELTHKKK